MKGSLPTHPVTLDDGASETQLPNGVLEDGDTRLPGAQLQTGLLSEARWVQPRHRERLTICRGWGAQHRNRAPRQEPDSAPETGSLSRLTITL